MCYVKPRGFPGGACGKKPACQCRRRKRCGFDPWVGKIPWRRAWQPTPVFLPGESHGQRSLVSYKSIELWKSQIWLRRLSMQAHMSSHRVITYLEDQLSWKVRKESQSNLTGLIKAGLYKNKFGLFMDRMQNSHEFVRLKLETSKQFHQAAASSIALSSLHHHKRIFREKHVNCRVDECCVRLKVETHGRWIYGYQNKCLIIPATFQSEHPVLLFYALAITHTHTHTHTHMRRDWKALLLLLLLSRFSRIRLCATP